MLDVASGLKVRWFMAFVAKRAAFFNGPERIFRIRRVVAFFTADFDDKGVRARSEEFRL